MGNPTVQQAAIFLGSISFMMMLAIGMAAAVPVSRECKSAATASDNFGRAHEAFRQHDFSLAARRFRLAIPGAECAHQLALRYGGQYDHTAAGMYLEMAGSSRVFLGLSYWHAGLLTKAVQAWDGSFIFARRFDYGPSKVPSEGSALLVQRHYRAAMSTYNIHPAMDEFVRSDIDAALRYGAAGNWEAARGSARAAVQRNPSNKSANFVLGVLFFEQNRVEDAQCQWLRTLELYEPVPEALDQNGDLEGLDARWLLIKTGRRFGIKCHRIISSSSDAPVS